MERTENQVRSADDGAFVSQGYNLIGKSGGSTGLINWSVIGMLADPTLELHNGDGSVLASNDNWRDTQEDDIIATVLPPTDDAE